jgi:hypothetical protein
VSSWCALKLEEFNTIIHRVREGSRSRREKLSEHIKLAYLSCEALLNCKSSLSRLESYNSIEMGWYSDASSYV